MSTPNEPDIALIAVVAANGVIGRDGDLVLRLPTDMKRFKAITMGHPVVMGRKTFESFRRPLPGRPNLVVSRDPSFYADGCEILPDIETAVERARSLAEGLGKARLYVLGGGQIYQQTIGIADVLEITHVDLDVEGDVAFPLIDPAHWRVESEQVQPAEEGDEADMVFRTYLRN